MWLSGLRRRTTVRLYGMSLAEFAVALGIAAGVVAVVVVEKVRGHI